MPELRSVDKKDVQEVWPFIMPYLASALRHDNGEMSLEGVAAALIQGPMMAWLVIDNHEMQGVVTTHIIDYDCKRTLEIVHFACAASREEWVPLFETLERWAAANGCFDIELIGRPGWRRVAPDMGFNETSVVMNKRVDYSGQVKSAQTTS